MSKKQKFFLTTSFCVVFGMWMSLCVFDLIKAVNTGEFSNWVRFVANLIFAISSASYLLITSRTKTIEDKQREKEIVEEFNSGIVERLGAVLKMSNPEYVIIAFGETDQGQRKMVSIVGDPTSIGARICMAHRAMPVEEQRNFRLMIAQIDLMLAISRVVMETSEKK